MKKHIRPWRRPEQLNSGLRLAVEAAGGSMSNLADMLSITPQAISQWDVVPVKRILEVERITKIRRERLRPDLYRKRKRKRSK